MFQFIGLFLAVALSWNISCCSKSVQLKSTVPNVEKSDRFEIPDSGTVAVNEVRDGDKYHYAFLCNFKKDQLEIVSVNKQEGPMNLIVASASDLFLAGYVEGNLVNYYRFADPLETHGTDHEAVRNQSETAHAFILMPKNIESFLKNKSYELAIYKITAYIDNFSKHVNKTSELKQLKKDKKIELIYIIDQSKIKQLIELK